jgi:transcriptional regulator with XRE-family HTH domain
MTALARWLQGELKARGLTQQAAATYAGVSMATISDILRKGHIPRIETLFRLADYFEVSRERVLCLAASLPAGPGAGGDREDYLVAELLEEFRQVPDEWKEVVLQQVAWLRQLAERPPLRIIGEEEDGVERQNQSQAA